MYRVAILERDPQIEVAEYVPPRPLRIYDFSGGVLPAGATFTRASTADYVNATGAFASAAANVPVWDWSWNGTGYARSAGMRLAPAQTNQLAAYQNPAQWQFSSKKGDIDSGLSCTFGTATEAGVTVVTAHITGTTPPGESYCYLTADKMVAGTTTLASAAAVGTQVLTLADVSNLVIYQTVTIGSGGTAEDVRISKITITGSSVEIGGDGDFSTADVPPSPGGADLPDEGDGSPGNNGTNDGSYTPPDDSLGVIQPGTITISAPLARAHTSGETVTRWTGLLTPDGSSVSAMGFLRYLAANKTSDALHDFRVAGGGDTDTASMSDAIGGVVSRYEAHTGNWVNNQAQTRAYFRFHFYTSFAWDFTVALGPLTVLLNQLPVAGPIINTGSGTKTRAAESVVLDLLPGLYDIVVDCVETGVEVRRGVAVGASGWTLSALPVGGIHLRSVKAYLAPLLDDGTGLTPPDYELDPSFGLTTNGAGAITRWQGNGGITADLIYGTDDEDYGGVHVDEAGLEMLRVSPNNGQYQLSGFEFSDHFSIAVAFRSMSLLTQALVGAGTATDDANNRFQLRFNDPLGAVSSIVDHVTVSRTSVVADDFSKPVVVVFTKDGTARRWDVNLHGDLQTTWDRDVTFLPSGDYKVLFQRYQNADAFDGDLFGLKGWNGPLSPTMSARICADWYARLAELAARTPLVPQVTRALVGAQTPSGFTIAWDVSDNLPVTWQVSSDGFGTIVWQQTITPAATDRSPSRSWFSAKTAVAGLAAATAYQVRPIVAGIIGGTQTVKTAPATGVVTPLRILLMSCSKFGSNHVPGLASAALVPNIDLAIHMGDLTYGNVNVNDVRVNRYKLLRTFASNPSAAALLASTALYWIWDDHDSGPNNNDRDTILPTQPDGTTPTMSQELANARQSYTETMPHPTLASSKVLAWTQDYGHIRIITPDLFSQRRIASGTVLNYGSGAFDQKGWLKAQLLAAGTAGRKFVILNVSSWDNWRRNCPAEWQEIVDYVRTTAGVPFVLVVSGDIHNSYADDGTNAGLPTVVSSPIAHGVSLQVPAATAWGAGAGLTQVNDPWQFATLDIGASAIVATLYGSPHSDTGATLVGSRSTADLSVPTVGFRQPNRKTLAGSPVPVTIDRSSFAVPGSTAHWSATNGQSGDLTFGPMTRSQSITINPLSAGQTVVVTLSSPNGCAIGQATTTITIGSQMQSDSGQPMVADDGTPMIA